jgi:hypothetical protein
MSEFIPAGVIHEIQISDKEMYAFEPVLCDAIYNHKREISDLRKKIGIPSEYPDTVGMLARIQSLEGQIVILEDILEQLDLS